MAILVLPTSSFVTQQLEALRMAAPDEIIHTDPDRAPGEAIEAMLAFRLPRGVAGRFPNLRFIACAGAGADEILAAPDLPHVPVVRPVDPLQAQRIGQYAAMMTLRFHRDLPRLEAQHRRAHWERFAPVPEPAVGILGFGASGRAVAAALRALGYAVVAWRRRPLVDAGDVACGPAMLRQVLSRAGVLVCTLPLTDATRGLLDARALADLPRGAYLIDVSRGGIVDHAALLEALASGRLAGAALDVFPEEPLPERSALWRHPRVLCTPHIGGAPRPDIAAAQFLDNLHRARGGLPLCNEIDRSRGY